jgi:RNA polymerase sigma-70 factor (ECF subfamily)
MEFGAQSNKKKSQRPGQISPSVFDELYDEYKTAVFSYACYLTRNRGEAEDLFQETWLRVVRQIPEKINKESVKAWMFTIVSNLHKDILRKKRRKRLWLRRMEYTPQDDLFLQGLVGGSPAQATRETNRTELGRDMARALSLLPDHQRRVFVLKEIAGFQQVEVSEILGIKLGTVKSLMHRAVKRLQQELSAYNPKGEKLKCDAKMLSV